MEHMIHEFEEIVARNPRACVLIFRSDCPTDATIFDAWGPEPRAEEEVRLCNKRLSPPDMFEMFVSGGSGQFDYVSMKAAIAWLKDLDTPWRHYSLNEYGEYASIACAAPQRAVRAYKARQDSL